MGGNQRFYYVFVGSYTPAEKEGIHIFCFDSVEGKLHRLGGTSGIDNPSFLSVDIERKLLFAVSEIDNGGSVVSLRFYPKSGALREINRQPSFGDYPCHLTVDPSGKWLLLVNYMSGSVCVYPIDDDGTIKPISQQVHHQGQSIHSYRQEGPHPHSIFCIPSTSFYLVPDLGTDTVYTYYFDRENGKLILQTETKVQPGSGPRHLAFHPVMPYVYLNQELSSTITVFTLDRSNGSLSPIQTISTLPEDFTGESTCAEILVSESGRFVYCSNRGHDSISVFQVLADGRLVKIGYTPSGGRIPRNFTLIPGERFLLTGNQESDSIIVMRVNEDGTLMQTEHRYEVGKPVCFKVVPVQ